MKIILMPYVPSVSSCLHKVSKGIVRMAQYQNVHQCCINYLNKKFKKFHNIQILQINQALTANMKVTIDSFLSVYEKKLPHTIHKSNKHTKGASYLLHSVNATQILKHLYKKL